MKRSASTDDTEDINPEGISKDEANGTKRRKTSLIIRLPLGNECTEAWKVAVNEVATEGLRTVSKESDGSLLLSFDTKPKSIVVIFKQHPWLELMFGDIVKIRSSSLKTEKVRLFARNDQRKLQSIDVIFRTTKDCETFLNKVSVSCLCKITSANLGMRCILIFMA